MMLQIDRTLASTGESFDAAESEDGVVHNSVDVQDSCHTDSHRAQTGSIESLVGHTLVVPDHEFEVMLLRRENLIVEYGK